MWRVTGWIVLLLTLSSLTAFGRVITVPDQVATIQAALNLADNGDEIVIRDGVYQGPGFENIRFYGKSVTVRSENGRDACILMGQFAETAFILDHGESLDSRIIGITFRHFSGAVRVFNSSVTIMDCAFESNRHSAGGAALRAVLAGIVLSGNVFTDNHGGLWGGAVQFEYVTGTVANCIFSRNTNDALYGGFHSFGGAAGVLFSPVDFVNCLFSDNVVRADIQNGYGARGGAVFLDSTGQNQPTRFINCTFYGNSAKNGGQTGGVYAVKTALIRNTIFWNNTPENVSGNELDMRFSLIQGGFPGQGNINTDPLFVSGAFGHYYLSRTAAGQFRDSPAVKAGNSSSSSICYPAASGNRCLNDLTTRTDSVYDFGTVDMGFHYPGPIYESLGMTLVLESHHLKPGEWFALAMDVFNSSDKPVEARVYLVMNANGDFWFWPSWTQDIQYAPRTVLPGLNKTTIMEFDWPVSGSSGEAAFIGLMTSADGQYAMGTWGLGVFSWE